ncbi:oxidoreductase NAD-binding domain-containing protein [Seiridium cupressi]
MAATVDTEFSAKDVASHKEADDCFMVIQGKVYDVTKYIHDHPGGADILVEAGGTDATEAFDNAGHSEDAFEIMEQYQVGILKGASKKSAPKPVKVIATPKKSAKAKSQSVVPTAVGATVIALGALGLYFAPQLNGGHAITTLPGALIPKANWLKAGGSKGQRFGFFEGVLVASGAVAVAGTVLAKKAMKLLDYHGDFMKYPSHIKLPKPVQSELLLQRGWLHPTTYQTLPLISKTLLAPNTYRFVFELPTSQAVLGLPIGQHVSIAATIDGKTVSRSYTPVSNNADKGVLELVIKCYPDGLLTGKYLANIEVGDEVQFRGPKGAMRYRPGLCKKIGMLAGGTGITPMYQLIRAICEDDRDTTEISLIYANRTEADILLREQLETMARKYPKNFKLFYLLDSPPANWQYGSGYVTKELMAEKFPAPSSDSRVMLCGPPGMVNAAKTSLVSLGYEKPAAMSTMRDQIFCF